MAETTTTLDYTKLKINELLQLCKDRGLKGCTGKKKTELINLLSNTSSTAFKQSDFVLQPMITYIGNKRALLSPIEGALQKVYAHLGRRKLRTFTAIH